MRSGLRPRSKQGRRAASGRGADAPDRFLSERVFAVLAAASALPGPRRPGGGADARGATRLTDLAESGPLRLRLPRTAPGPLEAVLLNSAGGIACGDHFRVEADLAPGADLVVTSTAAEKIYRSDGPTTRLDVALTVAGARPWRGCRRRRSCTTASGCTAVSMSPAPRAPR